MILERVFTLVILSTILLGCDSELARKWGGEPVPHFVVEVVFETPLTRRQVLSNLAKISRLENLKPTEQSFLQIDDLDSISLRDSVFVWYPENFRRGDIVLRVFIDPIMSSEIEKVTFYFLPDRSWRFFDESDWSYFERWYLDVIPKLFTKADFIEVTSHPSEYTSDSLAKVLLKRSRLPAPVVQGS